MHYFIGNFHDPSHFLSSAVIAAETILLLSDSTATGDDDETDMIDARVIVTAHEIYEIAQTETLRVGFSINLN